MDDRARLDALRRLKYLLDEAFRIPGTNVRFGWDPIVGVVPWVGDVLTALFSCAIVLQAHRMRVPRVVQLRMLINIVIDVLVGIVPVVGDAADVIWRSNSKNFGLLERHAAAARPPTAGDWLFVTAVIAAVLAVAVLPIFVLYLILHVIATRGWL